MDKIRLTDEYKAWRLIIKSAMKFPFAKYEEDIRKLHSMRSVRNLYGGRISYSKLLEAQGMEIHARSQIAEYKATATRVYYEVSRSNDAMKSFMSSNGYALGKTVGERNMSMDTTITKGYEIVSMFEAFIENCNIILADLDQAGWGLSRMASIIEAMSRPEKII